MDDPLRVHVILFRNVSYDGVLIPLLVDDPLRALKFFIMQKQLEVLIPLLVDDPLRGVIYVIINY